MGMYTELRFRATIKHKYRDLVAFINNEGDWKDAVLRFNFPWLKGWSEFSRSGMIPDGGSAYFDDDPDWERKFDPETGFWQVQCNLKNYQGTIEHFLAHILPEIASEVHEAWEHYEEDEKPRKVGVTCF
jgi:hypothetical protein